MDGCVELRLPEAAATSVGVGGVGTHGERSSDVVELAGIRRVQLKGIINDLLTVGGRKKREPAVASCR